MTAVVPSRRGFLGGLFASAAVVAVAAPSVPGLLDATQAMVEDAIAEARAFNLTDLMWQARFNVFDHCFDVVGKTREQSLLDAMNGILAKQSTFRVMPEDVARHLTEAYGRIWNDYRSELDQVELKLTSEQMRLPRFASLVPQKPAPIGYGRSANIEAGYEVQAIVDGRAPVQGGAS